MPPPLRAAARLGVTARPMNDEDLPFVAALYASTRGEELAALPWPDENKRAFLEQQHRAQHAHYRAHYADADWLILEREGQPIGRLYLDVWQDQLRIIDISLIAEARGEGIGGGILADVLAERFFNVARQLRRIFSLCGEVFD